MNKEWGLDTLRKADEVDRIRRRYLNRGESPPFEMWRWGHEFKEICSYCGTHVGGTEGQSVYREVELPDDGLDIICGECE